MIDLTPLDVRKKRGDFRRVLRGYDPQEVDSFLELVAERFEDLVKENLTLKERSERLESQVNSQEGREKAVQQALVTAQELREEIHTQAQREADFLKKEAEQQIDRILGDARRMLAEHESALEDLRRRRVQFLKSFKGLLTKELEMVELEEEKASAALEPLEIELSGGWRAEAREKAAEAEWEEKEETVAEEEGEEETVAEEEGEEEAAAEREEKEEAAAEREEKEEAVAEEGEKEEAVAEEEGKEEAVTEPEIEVAEPEAGVPGKDPSGTGGGAARSQAGAEEEAEGSDEPLWLSSLLREGEAKKSGKEKGEDG